MFPLWFLSAHWCAEFVFLRTGMIKICGILSILNQLYLLISSGNTLPPPLCSGITFSDGSSGWALILEDKLFLLFSESHRFTLSPVIFRLMSMTIFRKVAQVFLVWYFHPLLNWHFPALAQRNVSVTSKLLNPSVPYLKKHEEPNEAVTVLPH